VAKSIQVKPAQPAGKAAKSVAKAAPKSAAKSASSKSGSKSDTKTAAKATKASTKAVKAAPKAPAKASAKTAAKVPAAKAPTAKTKVAAKPTSKAAPAKAAKATVKAAAKDTKAAKPASKAKAPAKETKAPATKAPKTTATKAKPAEGKATPKATATKASAAKASKAAPKEAKATKAAAKAAKAPARSAEAKAPKAAAEPKASKAKTKAPALTGTAAVAAAVERSKLRAAQTLPPVGTLLTRREMEQLLTAGQGRGVTGEGSLKGRLIVKDDLPTLVVTGRDKRELHFVLQGPDQSQFPQFVEYRVSVSGLIRKTSNYAGTVDVRRYTAKRADLEETVTPEEPKLRYLSPGEVTQLVAASMGAGMKGFATVRGQLEMSGDRYVVVLSNGGTRHQVTFVLTGKNAKSLRKLIGRTVQVTGVADKTTGWGGTIEVESVEPRAGDVRKIDRKHLTVHSLRHGGDPLEAEVRIGEALSVRFDEEPEHTWAIEPMVAKRVALREVAFEPVPNSAGVREFFFTPRNVGTFEIEFYLGKLLSPVQVSKSVRMTLTVRA